MLYCSSEFNHLTDLFEKKKNLHCTSLQVLILISGALKLLEHYTFHPLSGRKTQADTSVYKIHLTSIIGLQFSDLHGVFYCIELKENLKS